MTRTGRVLFDTRFITAVIIDASNRGFFVPIKHVLGDYFIAEIETQIYVFSLKGARIINKRDSFTNSFRFILYETSHFMPISPQDNKELELVLEKNNLPKVNFMLFNILKELGRREKGLSAKKGKENELDAPHRLKDMVEEIADKENEFGEQVRSIKNYLKHLKVEEIVTPVRKMADFLDEDLFETDPGFYGEVVSRYKRTDIEHKIITNKPVPKSKHWFKWIAVGMMLGLMAVAAYMLLGHGGGISPPDLSHIIPGLPPPPGTLTLQDFQKTYPTPEAAKIAVDQGTLRMDQIPPELRGLVENFKPPVAVPKEQTVQLTP